METAAFVCPLSETGLRELGRMAINFGHLEFFLETRLRRLAKLDDPLARELIVPLTTARKLELLKAHLDQVAPLEARGLVAQACEVMTTINGERNDILHGHWGWGTDAPLVGKASGMTSKKPALRIDAARISYIADQAAIATRLFATVVALEGGWPVPVFPINMYQGDALPSGWPPLPG